VPYRTFLQATPKFKSTFTTQKRAHIKCGRVSPQQYNSMLGMRDMKWCCPGCLRHNTDPVRNVVTTTHTREITNPLKEMKENKII